MRQQTQSPHGTPPLAPTIPATCRLTPADGRALYDAEWLLANGLGGFAMGTACGVLRRKYHALLVASPRPPVQRLHALASLDATITLAADTGQARTIDLAVHRLAEGWSGEGGGFQPRGDLLLASFEHDTAAAEARWVWESAHFTLSRTLRMGHERNSCAVRFTLRRTRSRDPAAMRLAIRPLISLRDFHATLGWCDPQRFTSSSTPGARGGSTVTVSAEGHTIELLADSARFVEERRMSPQFRYDLDSERHQSDRERLFIPGSFEMNLGPGEDSAELVIAAALHPHEPDVSLFERPDHPRARHCSGIAQRAVDRAPDLEPCGPLIRSSCEFIVRRPIGAVDSVTVIAGYPWFADWGRDTMIALPGLLLCTARFDDALACLRTFAAHMSEGMIPNRFDDYGAEPEFNSVDAPLWFIHAACEYLRISGDRAGFSGTIEDACFRIIERYRAGTRFGIRLDPDDHLIAAGDASTQLTWMDAKRDGHAFTPRHGKAVEINALWIHGLRSLAEMLPESRRSQAHELRALADRCAESFIRAFLDPSRGCLHDCLYPSESAGRTTWTPSRDIRPNQVIAAALRNGPLDAAQRGSVAAFVREHLLTPFGLRTLAPCQDGYRPRCTGDMWSRDAAYHNGTAWPWLLGSYAEAVLRADDFSPAARAEVLRCLAPILESFSRPGAGGGGACAHIPEIFDAEGSPDQPQRPNGCPAQAWSLAEVLRALHLATARDA